MLFLAVGLLVAALVRRGGVTEGRLPPEARPDDGSAVVLSFPQAKKSRKRGERDSKANPG